MSSNFLDSFKSSFLTTKSPRIIRNQFQPVPIIPITRSGHSRGHRTKAAVKVMTNTRIVSKNFRTKVIDIMCYRNLINMSSRCQYDKYLMINTPSPLALITGTSHRHYIRTNDSFNGQMWKRALIILLEQEWTGVDCRG